MIVGIDLGTTNSLIGVIERGRPRLFPTPEGSTLLPSVVAYTEGKPPVVGAMAKARRGEHPRSTFASAKRFIGRGKPDVEGWLHVLPYNFDPSDEHMVRFRTSDGRTVTPIEVSAEILRTLKRMAEQGLGEKVTEAVVTVPAYFNDAQRQATKFAGELAGLNVLRIVNEPTAACLAYGLDKKTMGTIAVFDLGGGTFDISILRVKDGVFEVLATNGDTALGGDDFDQAIALALAPEVRKVTGVDPLATPESRTAMTAAAEAVKRRLSDDDEAPFRVTIGGKSFERGVRREHLEGWIGAVLARAEDPCRQCLKDAGLKSDAITDVILVGGSTRMPVVRELVQGLFRREPICTLNPDEVVAMGAAVQANILAGQTGGMLLLDVIPLSLGIETIGGVVSRIIHRNSPIPTSASESFSTYVDGQTAVAIHVVQGERELVKDNRSLARFELRGLPPLPAGVPKIEVEFIVDANGILNVRSMELRTGKTASIVVNPSYGLNDAEVERMLGEAIDHAEADFSARFLAEARVEADALVRAAKKSMGQGRALVAPDEAARIDAAILDLERLIPSEEREQIKAAITKLDETSRNLAERLLDHAVSQALKDKELPGTEKS